MTTAQLRSFLVRAGLRFADPNVEKSFEQHYAKRVYTILQATILLSILTYALFGLADITSPSGGIQSTRFRFMIAIPLLAAIFGLSVVNFARRYWYSIAVLFAIVASSCVFVTLVLYDAETEFRYSTGNPTINYMLVTAFIALLPLTTFGTLLVGLWTQALHAALIFWVANLPLNVSLLYLGHVHSIFVIILCVAYWRERLLRTVFADELQMQKERETFKSQFPSYVTIDALSGAQSEGRAIANVFGEVTVLFCDIVNFTSLAERVAPKHLVELLSEVFCRLDEIESEHNVEKVKTIGDAYMAISGTSNETRNSAEDMADFALAILRGADTLSDKIGHPIQFRIGMHTGSLIGGVIGRRKMIYDYWGKTVNVASRLESTAQTGRIQVSEATYWRLKRDFELEERGPIDLKGLGSTSTYFLIGRRHVGAV